MSWESSSKLLHNFPREPGCYVIRCGDIVLYVGKAGNLRQRWLNHHHRYHIERTFPNATVEIILCDEDRHQKERELISKLKPIMNGRRRFMGSRPIEEQLLERRYFSLPPSLHEGWQERQRTAVEKLMRLNGTVPVGKPGRR